MSAPYALSETITMGGTQSAANKLPAGYRVDTELGLALHASVKGQVVHTARWPERGLYECRATKTPGGDFLLMFPDGGHYGHAAEKNNDMLARPSRSRDLPTSAWTGRPSARRATCMRLPRRHRGGTLPAGDADRPPERTAATRTGSPRVALGIIHVDGQAVRVGTLWSGGGRR